jgi:trans-aconitate methyltransferase
MIVWGILFLILVLVAATEFSTWRTGVPTLASFRPSRRKIIDELQTASAAHKGSTPFTIVDLGSGNGQLATQIARALPKATVTGVEISMVPWLISWTRRIVFGPANLRFRRESFWPFDCTETDAVVAYLNGAVIKRVSEKLHAELKPGALVITNEIPLQDGWKPIDTIPTGFLTMKIYVYRQGDAA